MRRAFLVVFLLGTFATNCFAAQDSSVKKQEDKVAEAVKVAGEVFHQELRHTVVIDMMKAADKVLHQQKGEKFNPDVDGD